MAASPDSCHVWVAVRMDPLHLDALVKEYRQKFGPVVVSGKDVSGQERGIVVGRLRRHHGDSKGNFHHGAFFAVSIHHGPVPQQTPQVTVDDDAWVEVTVEIPGHKKRKGQAPMRLISHQSLAKWNPQHVAKLQYGPPLIAGLS